MHRYVTPAADGWAVGLLHTLCHGIFSLLSPRDLTAMNDSEILLAELQQSIQRHDSARALILFRCLMDRIHTALITSIRRLHHLPELHPNVRVAFEGLDHALEALR